MAYLTEYAIGLNLGFNAELMEDKLGLSVLYQSGKNNMRGTTVTLSYKESKKIQPYIGFFIPTSINMNPYNGIIGINVSF